MAYGGYGIGGYGTGAYGYHVGGGVQGTMQAAQGTGQGTIVQSKGKEEEQIFDTRKMFVGCVKKTTPEETFISFFASFGDLEKASLKKAYDGSGHRGFGFVIYKDQATTDAVMAQAGQLELDGRNLNIELAIPSNMQPPEGVDNKKLFIGNIPKDGTGISTDELTQYFSQFGEVESAFGTRDKGFGFVTFKSENGAYKALAHGLKGGHTIRENLVLETKWPKPKPVAPMGAMGMGYNIYNGGFAGVGGFVGRGGYAVGAGFPGGGGFRGGFAGVGGFVGGGGFAGAGGYGPYAGRFQPY